MITNNRSNRGLRSLVLLMLSAVIGISGCFQTMPMMMSSKPLTPEEQRLREQGEVFNKTVIEGLAIGTLLGILLGAIIGRDAKSAAAGGAAGAVLGGVTGSYLAQKQREYANAEQRTDAMIAEVRTDNERVAGLLKSAKEVIAADKRKIQQLQRQMASGEITKENAKKELASVEANERYLQKTIGNLNELKQGWKDIARQTRSEANARQKKDMNREIGKLEKQIASLEKELDTLVQRRKILPVA